MKKLKLVIWIFALANIVVALAGLCLSLVSETVFVRVLDGHEAIPSLTSFYFEHRYPIFAVSALGLFIAALVLIVRGSITSEVVLLFGAVTVLLIALQALLGVLAVGRPLYILQITPFRG